jgi:hypothetical protein
LLKNRYLSAAFSGQFNSAKSVQGQWFFRHYNV